MDLRMPPTDLPMTKPCGCPHEAPTGVSRRMFLKGAGTAVLAGLMSEGLSTRVAFAGTPYNGDVLVVLSLRGGFDGVNAIVPIGDADYAPLRPNIAIPQNAAIQLDSLFGMHPAMASLKPFYDAGTFGAVHAVGMVQPNRSHFDAMEEMERAAPGSSTRTGWLDRVLGLRDTTTAFQGTQMGSGMPASAFLGPSPELSMWSVDSFGLDAAWDDTERLRWDAALRGLQTGAPAALSQPALGALDAMATTATLKANGYVPANGAVYPDTDLGNAMKDVARLIKADVGLQVAAVDYGDWDMHAGMGTADAGWMHDHLTELSDTLAAFATDLGTQLNDVTLVTLTEFGRCVGENGSGGVDHGFGQAVLLLGGGVVGGKVHGTWPTLAPDALIDNDLNATTEYRTLLAEILEKRCGTGSVSDVFPGISSDRLGIVTPRA